MNFFLRRVRTIFFIFRLAPQMISGRPLSQAHSDNSLLFMEYAVPIWNEYSTT